MTAHEALSHPFVAEHAYPPDRQDATDLLPVIKKNFNARRTLHAAIDTIRAINKLREGGGAAMMAGAMSVDPNPGADAAGAAGGPVGAVDGVGAGGGGSAAAAAAATTLMPAGNAFAAAASAAAVMARSAAAATATAASTAGTGGGGDDADTPMPDRSPSITSATPTTITPAAPSRAAELVHQGLWTPSPHASRRQQQA